MVSKNKTMLNEVVSNGFRPRADSIFSLCWTTRPFSHFESGDQIRSSNWFQILCIEHALSKIKSFKSAATDIRTWRLPSDTLIARSGRELECMTGQV